MIINKYQETKDGVTIWKSSHVAIVNFVTGSKFGRTIDDIYLIQAIGSPDDYDTGGRLKGRVTDSWTWGDMDGNGNYIARRLKP